MNSHLRALLWVLLAAFVFPASPFVARAWAVEPPTLTVPPADISRPAGSSAVFSVTVTGTAPLTYQWYRGDSGDVASPVPGATGPLLVTQALTATTRFWVRVTNAGVALDSLDSPAATVTLTNVPTQPMLLGAMGENYYGQLGDGSSGSTIGRRPPVKVAIGVASVSTGNGHTLFVKSDGSLWAMGDNRYGQLGDGSTSNRSVPVQVATGVASVSAGNWHTLFVKVDGSLWAMGNNGTGQLGDGSTANRNAPVQVATGVASVSAGGSSFSADGSFFDGHSLFVKADGSVWAMGLNGNGQLGDGSNTSRSTPVQVATGVASVSAGAQHTLFIKTDGSLWTTGENYYGQLGDGSNTDRNVPVQVATDVASASAGDGHTVFVKTDDSLWATGHNAYGQFGNGTWKNRTSPIQVATGVASVSAGAKHTLFVKSDGSLWAMGMNPQGLSANGSTSSYLVPFQVALGVASVSAACEHSLFVATPRVVSFSLGTHATRAGGGALVQAMLDGTAAEEPTLSVAPGWAFTGWDVAFSSVTTDLTVTAQYVVPTPPIITASPAPRNIPWRSSTTLTVTASANAPLSYQWYRGESGDVAAPVTGATGPLLVTPSLATTTRFWVRVANAGLTVDSPVATVSLTGVPSLPLVLGATGYNGYGQLGDGSTTDRSTPVQAAAGVASVAAGSGYTLFVTTDGALWAMGYNSQGQLGDGSTTSRSTPVQVATGVASVSIGYYHTLFVKTDGSLWAMGSNAQGQFGDGSTTSHSTPVQVATGVASVSANSYHTLFVKTDLSLWAMGDNANGQLGDGSTTKRTTPVKIASAVASVSAGVDHTLFVKVDGSLWAMGDNSYGQLGYSAYYTPIQVATAVASASASLYHSLFVKTDRSLWAMGRNDYGQLGGGSSTNRNTPVQIAADVASVSAGSFHTLFVATPRAVTFALGTHGTRTGGGDLVQTVISGTAAVAPTLSASPGWAFTGWNTAFSAVTGDLTVTAQFVVPTLPVVSVPPVARNTPWQSSTSLTVSASANAPLGYQWYRGESGDVDSPVSGATGPLLVTPNLTITTRFWVRVNNAGLTVDSPAATITLTGVPSHPLILAAMGANDSGQLGDGSTTNRNTPIQVASGIVSISARGDQTLFVKTDGSLWAMGQTDEGQLGDGSSTDRSTPVQVATGVASVSAGASHTVFVKTDGSLWAMGQNESGQLGDGSTTRRTTPVQVATGVASVSVGGYHTLFVKTDGSLWAMGSNYYGQLGDGSSTRQRNTPVQVATGVGSVSAGGFHTLFVKTDGSLWAMGYNNRGQLGNGSSTDRSTPVQVATGVATVSAGNGHTLFVKADSSLWAVGENGGGQLGDGSTFSRNAPIQVATGVAYVSAGKGHTLFVKTDGSLWAMGYNSYGQLGGSSTNLSSTPIRIASSVNSASTGWGHTVFAATPRVVTFDIGTRATRLAGGALVQKILNGTAAEAPSLSLAPGWAFTGWNADFTNVTADVTVTAQYVVPTPPVISSPPMPRNSAWQNSATLTVTAYANAPLTYQWYRGESGDVTSPVAGATGTLLVTPPLATTTRFWVRVANAGLTIDSPAATVTITSVPSLPMALGAMGYNVYGQLGDGSETIHSSPVQITSGVASVSTGSLHTLFVKTDGSLWAVGNNDYGQLGDGSTTRRSTPVQVATGVVSVSTGNSHTLFVKSNGSLWAMGDNRSRQLGDGSISNRSVPVQVATGVASVSAGAFHTLFAKADGSLWAMGDNGTGQLGDGSISNLSVPVQVASGVASVSAGASHTLFVKSDGSLWAMGYNGYGQLGDGSTTRRYTPVQVATGVASVSAGDSHTLFVKMDGSLWAMGENSYGQLGDGSAGIFVHHSTPIQVTSGVASVSAGAYHTVFVKTDGSLWAMGWNTHGQLGDGSTTDRTTPVQIFSHVASVTAGGNQTLFVATPHVVTFSLGAHATLSGGGALVQTILNGTAAVAPTLTLSPGWVFTGWDVDFSNITADLIVTAQYVEATRPVLSAPASLRDIPLRSGASAVLSVTATANGPLAYQWYRGESGDTSAPVPGATGPLLVTPALTATTRFWVRVSNSGVAADSPAATATVTQAPPFALFGMIGDNSFGQLGNGTTTYQADPIEIATNVASAASGGAHTLFLKTDGSLWATGNNYAGQLGDGTTTSRSTPVQIATAVASVSAGQHHTLFIKTDGSLWDTSGFVSSGNTPVQIATGVVSASAGNNLSCFIRADGTLWAVGALAYGDIRYIPVQIATDVISVSAGNGFTVFVKTDGSLWGVGSNFYGQLGGGTTNYSAPIQITTDVVSVSASSDYYGATLFIKNNNSLWAMGANNYGRLGDSYNTHLNPVQVATDVASVSAGEWWTNFVKIDGTLWAMGFGFNNSVILADGTPDLSRYKPIQIATGVASVYTNGNILFTRPTHTVTFDLGAHGTRTGGGELTQYVLYDTAAVAPAVTPHPGWALAYWDRAFDSVSGDLHITAQYIVPTAPVISTPPSPVVPVGPAAPSSSVALSVTATGNAPQTPLVYQWYRGPSGDTSAPLPGATGPLLVTPPLTATTPFWVRIANADASVDSPTATVTVAPQRLAVMAMGRNDYGQLGDGTTTDQRRAVQLTPEVASISTGGAHTLFIKTDGSLWASGQNHRGQLGDGTATNRSSPVQIATDVVAADASAYHSLFIKTDGSLWSMGDGVYGYFPSNGGPPPSRTSPAQIATGVASVSSNAYYTLFVKFDGSLWLMHGFDNSYLAVKITTGVISTARGVFFIKTDGTLWTIAAGLNLDPLFPPPLPIQRATNVASVSTFAGHTLFVKRDGTLWAMGDNSHGQLGNGSIDDTNYSYPNYPSPYSSTPIQVATGVASASAGSEYSLFVKIDGSLWATGRNTIGQLGYRPLDDYLEFVLGRSTPVQVATDVASAIAGGENTFYTRALYAVTYDLGTLGTRTGGGALQQSVQKNFAAVAPTVAVSPGWALASWDVAFDQVTTDLTVTARYVVVSAPVITVPPQDRVVAAFRPVTSLSVTVTTNAPLTVPHCQWYRGESGDTSQPIAGATDPLLVMPTPLTTARYWVRVTNFAGTVDSPAATITRAAPEPLLLSGMGENYGGSLGDGTTTFRPTPVQVATETASVAVGTQARFIKTDGSLWATGVTQLQIATGVASVSVGNHHTAFVKSDGSLWAVGDNSGGQFGDGTTTSRATPVQIATGVVAVSAGYSHTLSIKTDGSLWAAGYNSSGQLGDGTFTNRSTPVQIASGVAAVSAGSVFSCFIKTDGSLWTMGYNEYYKMPFDSFDEFQLQFSTGLTTPIQVATGVVSVSAGNSHTLFVKADGSLWALGGNTEGQLGDGTFLGRATPVQVATGVASASAGSNGNASVFVKTDGTLWAMGSSRVFDIIAPDSSPYHPAPFQITSKVAFAVTGAGNIFFATGTPRIAIDPVGAFNLAGKTHTLTVTPAGDGPFTYQWNREGAPIDGATAPTLPFTAFTAANNGRYSVTVTGPFGSVTSGVARLSAGLPWAEAPATLTRTIAGTVALDLRNGLLTPGLTWAASGLPAGLKLDPKTGLLIGRITAKAGTYAITLWTVSGKTKGEVRTLSLTVQPYPATLVGGFEGLLTATSPSAGAGLPAGKLTLSVVSGGGFTGTLVTPLPKTYVLKGDLAVNDAGTAALVTLPVAPYSLALTLDAGGKLAAALTQADAPRGSLTDGVRLAAFTGKSPSTAPWAAPAYTLALGGPRANLDLAGPPRAFPGGAGYATGSVDAKGLLKLSGKLADGRTLTAALAADASGGYRLYVQPYGQALAAADNYLAGWLRLVRSSEAPVRYRTLPTEGGDIYWHKPAAAKDANYRFGFGPVALTARLATWIAPNTRANAPLPTTLAAALALPTVPADLPLAFAGGGLTETQLAGLPDFLRLDAKGLFAAQPTPPVKTWTFAPVAASGKFTGSFAIADPATTPTGKPTTRSVAFEGVLLQLPVAEASGLLGAGYFLAPPRVKGGVSEGGALEISRTP